MLASENSYQVVVKRDDICRGVIPTFRKLGSYALNDKIVLSRKYIIDDGFKYE